MKNLFLSLILRGVIITAGCAINIYKLLYKSVEHRIDDVKPAEDNIKMFERKMETFMDDVQDTYSLKKGSK